MSKRMGGFALIVAAIASQTFFVLPVGEKYTSPTVRSVDG